jgi:hypothetical protein
MAELLNLQGKCPPLRAKTAHFVSHLPEMQGGSLFFEEREYG